MPRAWLLLSVLLLLSLIGLYYFGEGRSTLYTDRFDLYHDFWA